MVDPKTKPKRVIPARPGGKAPIKPRVQKKPKQPVKKTSSRKIVSPKKPETIVDNLVNSATNNRSKPKSRTEPKSIAQALMIKMKDADRKEKKEALNKLIENLEEKLKKMGPLPDPFAAMAGGTDQRIFDEAREWMGEINAAKAILRNFDSGIGTDEISRRRNNAFSAEARENRRRARAQVVDANKRKARLSELVRRPRKPGKSWKIEKTPLEEEKIQEPQKPKGTNAGVIDALVAPQRDPILKPFAPMPEKPGEIPVPPIIKNPRIQTLEKAKEHFDDGGDLADIPEEYWFKVVSANANQPEGIRRVREIEQNGGIVKQIKIFVFEEDNQGIVFNRQVGDQKDAVREIMAQNMMVALGLNVGPARMDGNDGGWEDEYGNMVGDNDDFWAVMPFAWNFAPPGGQQYAPGEDGEENYWLEGLRELPDRALRERLAGLLYNFALQIPDRHDQNGFANVFKDKNGVLRPYVLPIDLGWFGKYGDLGGFLEYAGHPYGGGYYGMDRAIISDINDLLDPEYLPQADGWNAPKLSTKERMQLRQDLTDIYDQFIERVKILSEKTQSEFVDEIKNGFHIDNLRLVHGLDDLQEARLEREIEEGAERLWGLMQKALTKLQNDRQEFVERILA
jgi:hypothetical protein